MTVVKSQMTYREGVGQPCLYHVTTFAELPTADLLANADIAFCYEDKCWYIATSTTAWAKASTAHSHTAQQLGSGTPTGSKYLRDDLAWTVPPGGGGTPSDTVVSETTAGQAASAGVADTFSRGDHTHGTPAAAGGSETVTAVTVTAPYNSLEYSETVADDGVTTASKILASLGQTTVDDENGAGMDDFTVSAACLADGNLTLTVWSDQPFGGPIKLNYLIGS